MNIGSFPSLLRQGRARWGLDETATAAAFGLNVSSYEDLEAHDDEWFAVTPAIHIANIVNFFGIDWRACRDWPRGASVDRGLPLDELCRGLRGRLALTREEFAERAGFHTAFCDVIEGHPMGLSLWPVEVAVTLADVAGADALALAEAVLQPPGPIDLPPPLPSTNIRTPQHE